MVNLAELLDPEEFLVPLIGPRVPPAILGIGSPEDDETVGTPLADRINVLAGNDTVLAGAGDDRVFGRAGNDILIGGKGDDRLEGGAGNDRLAGGRGSDIVNGGAGDDLVLGGRGIDRLGGQGGDDRIVGGTGHDLLFGGRGSDLLDGGPGADTLTGGAGRDTFAFSGLAHGIDTITDFRPGIDQLDLSLLLPDFVDGDPLAEVVRLTLDGDDTLVAVKPDGNGGDFVEIARLEGVQTDALSPADLGLPEVSPPAGIVTLGDLAEDSSGFRGFAADGQFVTRADAEQSAQAAPADHAAAGAEVLSSGWVGGAEDGAATVQVVPPTPDLGSLVDVPNAAAG